MTAICASHHRNPLNDWVGLKHHHPNRFRPRQSSRSAFYKPGLVIPSVADHTHEHQHQHQHAKDASKQLEQQQLCSRSDDSSSNSDSDSDGKWSFRPSALQRDEYGTGAMSVNQLVDLYVRDNERALREGVVVPPKPRRSEQLRARLALAQQQNVATVKDALFSASSACSGSRSRLRLRSGVLSSSSLPSLPSSSLPSSEGTVSRTVVASQLRCLQWNIQAFTSPRDERNLHTVTAGMIRSICDTDSDVLVLNEIHWRDMEQFYGTGTSMCYEHKRKAIHSSQSLLEEVLRLRGYHFLRVSEHGDTPTLIATRKKVLRCEEVVLSNNRSALCVLVEDSTTSHLSIVGSSHGSTGRQHPSRCWVVGTHLDAFDAAQRRTEIRKLLLARFAVSDQNHNDLPMLIMGDFNQQRARDYAPREWERIAGSANLRKVPLDDGVGALLEGTGFRCVLDDVRVGATANANANANSTADATQGDASAATPTVRCNWNPHQPPPSTHWSGTTIDYTYYYSNDNDNDNDNNANTDDSVATTSIAPHGVYVGPAGFSDHRMTVTDWTLATTTAAAVEADKDHLSHARSSSPLLPPPTKYLDKELFFGHLPAGRHHSWFVR